MNDTSRPVIVGLFLDRCDAQRAVNELRRSNFREDQVGVVSRSAAGIPPAEVPAADAATHSKIVEGTALGAASGAGLGALWALGIAAGALPALGPVIAGGLLMSVLASAGATAAVGTVVGALIGLGIPEEDAWYFEKEFNSGRTLVTVRPEGRWAEAEAILRDYGALDLQSGAAGARAAGLSEPE
jgi:hypothetical protein